MIPCEDSQKQYWRKFLWLLNLIPQTHKRDKRGRHRKWLIYTVWTTEQWLRGSLSSNSALITHWMCCKQSMRWRCFTHHTQTHNTTHTHTHNTTHTHTYIHNKRHTGRAVKHVQHVEHPEEKSLRGLNGIKRRFTTTSSDRNTTRR